MRGNAMKCESRKEELGLFRLLSFEGFFISVLAISSVICFLLYPLSIPT